MNSTIRINLYIRKDAAPELFMALEKVSARKRGEVIRRLAMQALCTHATAPPQASSPTAVAGARETSPQRGSAAFDADLARLLGQQE